MSQHRIIAPDLPNIPWQERPEGNTNSPLWRYDANPIIDRNPIPGVARIFNSAVMPYEGAYIGVFRAEQTDGVPFIYLGRSADGIHWEFEQDRIPFTDEEGKPFVLGMIPTEIPVPIEVQFSRQTYRLAVTVVPDPAGTTAPPYETPDPAGIDALSFLYNDRPVTDLTVHAGRFYELYVQGLPGGRLMASWASSDESVATVSVRADGCCLLDTLRPSAEPITITAVYGEHRAELRLSVDPAPSGP